MKEREEGRKKRMKEGRKERRTTKRETIYWI
jgi:hypothetical protein